MTIKLRGRFLHSKAKILASIRDYEFFGAKELKEELILISVDGKQRICIHETRVAGAFWKDRSGKLHYDRRIDKHYYLFTCKWEDHPELIPEPTTLSLFA